MPKAALEKDTWVAIPGDSLQMGERREIGFLLEGTAVVPDRDQILKMREHLDLGVDWTEVLRLAIPHGVLPLLTRNLAKYAEEAVPQTTLSQLNRIARKVAEQARVQSLELSTIVSALSRDGFRVLPFKGPTLALAFYGDIGLRESHDLDLWIDPSQFVAAVEWLRGAGYRPVHHVQGVPQELSSCRERQEEFLNPQGTMIVDIKGHIEWSRASLFDPPFEQVWNRRGSIMMNGFEMGVISVEDLLPCLAVHGSKHLWRRLNWIADIAAVLSSSPGPEWEMVLSRATDWRCRRRLLTAVGLASVFYATETPALLRQEIQKPVIRSTIHHICLALFQEKCHSVGALGSEVISGLRSGDSMSERMRYSRTFLRRLLHADETRMMVPMSDSLRRLYRASATVRETLKLNKTE